MAGQYQLQEERQAKSHNEGKQSNEQTTDTEEAEDDSVENNVRDPWDNID